VEFSSLTALAERRQRRAATRGLNELTFQPFKESKILFGEERVTLYLCLPFKAQPLTHLLFSAERDRRSIHVMHELIDEIGITVILLQSGPFKFGGFAASKWRRNGLPFGQGSSSFLFSMTRDAHIPLKKEGEIPLLATEDTLSFGQADLALDEAFEHCSADIEHNYGVGFEVGSQEAQTFLAGAPQFRPDAIEVWGFFTVEQ
jgi:hypothetical protein